jgi:hypothetical protein
LKVSHAGFYHEKRPRAAEDGHQRYPFKAEDDGRSCWVFKTFIRGAAFRAGVQPGDILCESEERD